MGRDTPLERWIRSLGGEAPSPGLRERVLDLARAAGPPRVTLAERLWASRPLRLAWAAGLAALLLLDPIAVEGAPRTAAAGGRAAGAADAGMLAREIGLPAHRVRGLLAARRAGSSGAGLRPEERSKLLRDLEI